MKGSASASPKHEWLDCFAVEASLSHAPAVGETAVLQVRMSAEYRRANAEVSVDLPDNLEWVDGPPGLARAAARSRDGVGAVSRASGRTDFAAGQSRSYVSRVRAISAGPAQIRANVTAAVGGGRVDAASDNVFLTVAAPGRGPSKLSIDTPAVGGTAPITAPVASGPIAPLGPLPPLPPSTPLPEGGSAPAPTAPGQAAPAAGVPGQSCVSGSWYYVDQTGTLRGARIVYIEAWDNDFGAGDDLIATGFTDFGGGYTLCFNNNDESGATQEVYVRFIEDNNQWGMKPVLNFASGTTPTIADNTTYNIGGLQPSDGTLHRGLHAYDAAVDSYYWTPGYPCWDPNDTVCRKVFINWGPSSTDGTYWNGEVHLAADDPNAPLVVNHEIGHNEMYDLYDGYFPAAPSCNPHSIFGPSSTGCAWTEGWAEWYPAAIYNDPNFRWPNGAVQPLETPTWGYATPGDTLEGWVAGALIDIADHANEGPWDRAGEGGGLTDPGTIFAVSANDGYHPDVFSNFWNRRAALGFDVSSGGAGGGLYQSTIDYGYRNPLTSLVEQRLPTPPASHHKYSYVTPTNYWSAAAVRPPSGSDYDINVYDDFNQTALLAGSLSGGSDVDFVAVDSNRRPAGDDYYPRVNAYSGSGSYDIEWTGEATSIWDGSEGFSFAGGDVVRIRDTFLTGGVPTYFRVVPTAGLDAEVFLMSSTAGSPGTYVQGRAQALAASSADGFGGAESFRVTEPTTQWDGLVLVNRSGSGSATVYRDTSAPAGSVVIDGDAAETTTPDVTLDLSVADPETGLDQMQISTDGALDTEPWVAFAANAAVTLPAGDGTKTVLARVGNNAGMISPVFSDSIVLDTSPGGCTINGTAGNDILTGTAGDDVICGLGGDDTINAGDGNDIIDAGDGNDTVAGGAGHDDLLGGAGNDMFVSEAAADGADFGAGGAGTDTISYAARTAAVTVTIDGFANDGSAGEGDNVDIDVENVTGGKGADNLTGSAGKNKLVGGVGNDTLGGLDGKDTLTGGKGRDQLNGGPGDDTFPMGSSLTADGSGDTVNGGTGIDVVKYTRSASVNITLDDVANDGEVGEADQVQSDVENVLGGTGADTITGSASANALQGGGGNDSILGGLGSDQLAGDGGDDTLDSRDGINANDGNDGGTGTDTCRANTGDTKVSCEA